MVDDSELDYIRTFLGKIHTAATVKQIQEAGNLTYINDTQRMLVLPGELIAVFFNWYIKRYKVQISETSEANLTTAINNIIIGIEKLNRRETITAYTRPSTLIHCKLVNSNKAFFNATSQRWDCDIFLDFEWSTS